MYGTVYHVSYQSETDYAVEIRQEMERVNQSLSMFNKNSVIARWNRGECEQVDSLFVIMYRKAKEVNEATGGAFDVTVGPLVNAWGFGFKNEKLPSGEKVDSLLQYVGMDKVQLEGEQIMVTFEGGYSTDRQGYRLKDGILNIGLRKTSATVLRRLRW